MALCAFPACHELPPVVPEGYLGSPAAPGWPPLAVYDADPFSPRNRWFHREWSGRSPDGAILPAHADQPLAASREPRAADLAELGAILEACETMPTEPGGLSQLIFLADVSAEASRIAAEWPESPLRASILDSLRKLAGESMPASPRVELVPPPFRSGGWTEAGPPEAPGLLPSAVDSRRTRVFRRGDGAVALARYPVVGYPPETAKPLPFPTECWTITRENGAVVRSVDRLDRAELLSGNDPWRRLPRSAELSIRSPRDAAKFLEGTLEELCASCHCGVK